MAGVHERITRSFYSRNPSQSRSSSPDSQKKRKQTRSASSAQNNAKKNTIKPAKSKPSRKHLENEYHDLCDACNGPGKFLCCENCPNVFHFACVDPPMEVSEVENLKGAWYCNECNYSRNRKRLKTTYNTINRRKTRHQMTVFEVMAQNLEGKNPVEFSLPESIRNYFEGVSTASDGTYVDATTTKLVKYSRNGRPEEQDYHRLKDKDDNYIYCYWCRQTALKKQMIPCDYCSLYWHLDCLTPPLTIPPSINKKWKCPCHPQQQTRRRIPRQHESNIDNVDPFKLTPENTSMNGLLDKDRYLNSVNIHACTGKNHLEGHLSPASNDIADRSKQVQSEATKEGTSNEHQHTDSIVIRRNNVYILPKEAIGTNFLENAYKLITKKAKKKLKSASKNHSANNSSADLNV